MLNFPFVVTFFPHKKINYNSKFLEFLKQKNI